MMRHSVVTIKRVLTFLLLLCVLFSSFDGAIDTLAQATTNEQQAWVSTLPITDDGRSNEAGRTTLLDNQLTDANLLQGKVSNNYLVTNEESQMLQDLQVTLEAGVRYAIYAETSGAKGIVSVSLGNDNWAQVTTAESSEVRAYQYLFVPTVNTSTISILLRNDGTSGEDMLVKRIALCLAPDDGSFNLIPAGSCDVQSSVFAKSFDAGVSLVDPLADGNLAMFWPAGSSSIEKTWTISGIREKNATNTLLKLTFSFKGSLRIYEGMNGQFVKNEDCDRVSGSNYYYSSEDWKNVTILMDTGVIGHENYLYFRREGSDNTLLLDNVCLTEWSIPTAIHLDKKSVAAYPNDTIQLSISERYPANAYFSESEITWLSSNPDVAVVDESGSVTVSGSASIGSEATITAQYNERVCASCIVQVVMPDIDADLTVTGVSWDNDTDDLGQVNPNVPLIFAVQVKNQGVQRIPAGATVDVVVSIDAKPISTVLYSSGIDSGETVTVYTQTPWEAVDGDHMVTASIAARGFTEEIVANNNITRNLRVNQTIIEPPANALAQGFNKLVFSDDFKSIDTIDTTASGNHGYKWYITRPWGESNLTPDDYRVENGVLYVTTHQTAWNYSMCTIDAKNPGVGYGFNTGYMEIRLRMKETGEDGKVTGIRVPAVWAFSCDTIWGTRPKGQASLELDWIEYWGNKYGDLRFDTTLHETRYDENGNLISKVSSGEKHYEPIGDYQWHTYGMAWSKGLLKTYFDNELIGTQRYSEDDYPDPMPNGMVNIGGGDDPYEGLWSILDKQTMPIILGGASDFPLEVDWVRVWQSDGTLLPEDEEPEQGEGNNGPNVEGYIDRNVTLKKGTVSCTIDPTTGKKRDFGGKTYTFATVNSTDKYRTMVQEYENAYNVKIRMDAPGMDLYRERVASMQAAGAGYDILYMYDTWFPTEITNGFVVPFDPYITTADLWDPVKKEGFSMSRLEGFAWNNHAYCAAGAYQSGCTGIFYNKKMFGSAGQPDLLDLYYKGQLTWEKLYEIGSAINDPANGVYFINNFSNYYNSAFCVSYGTDFVKLANGGAKENLSDPQLATALQMFQKFTAGEGRLTDRTVKADESNGLDAFEMGTTASVIASPASWTHIRTAIEDKAVAFDKDIANIGWVPLPEQNEQKSNVMGSFDGISIGSHSTQPYVAVTFAHWMSGHNHDGAYVDGMNEEIRKISCELLDKDNYKAPVSGFSSSAGSVQGIRNNICRAVAGGGDISSTLRAYKKNLQRVLDAATTGGQAHVHVYDGACDTVCNGCDTPRTATADHIYDDEYDADCNACGDIRDVIVPDGWVLRSDGWKYYKNNTAQTGWLFVNDTWYFLKDDGVMATGWVQLGNTWYYMHAGGAMHTGWLQLGNNWYYMNAGGDMHTGWLQLGNTWYYMNAGGAMTTGWQYVGGTYYYLAESGAMQTGWLQLGGTWYYLSAGGGMVTGWQYIGNTYYYFAASGAMQTGWLQLGGTWYYLNAGGAMQTGWLQLGGTWYYLNAGGAMQTGWLQLGNVWYYMHPSGAMATGTVTVDGVVYRFNSSGVWLP